VTISALIAVAGACGGAGGWDLTPIEARHPHLSRHAGHRLADLAPSFWLTDEELLLFVCRWRDGEAVAVWTEGASEPERALLERALRALEGAVPGLVFELGSSGGPQGIEVAFEDLPGDGDEGGQSSALASGDTTADCRVDDVLGGPLLGDPLEARLESASVRVRRSRLDALGRIVPLERVELFAALLHELGHAIGYAAHAARGKTVMRLAPSEVRLQARPVLEGRRLDDPTLAALYAMPSGTVVRRDPLPEEARVMALVFTDLARREHWGTARSRAGQRSAEIWWGEPGARRVLRASRTTGRWPAYFSLRPNAAARDALRRSTRRPGA